MLFRPSKDTYNLDKTRSLIPVANKGDEKHNFIDGNTIGIVIDPRTRKAVGVLENVSMPSGLSTRLTAPCDGPGEEPWARKSLKKISLRKKSSRWNKLEFDGVPLLRHYVPLPGIEAYNQSN